jgi:hypothetical protein
MYLNVSKQIANKLGNLKKTFLMTPTAKKTMPPTILLPFRNIRCRSNAFTELLPSNDSGLHNFFSCNPILFSIYTSTFSKAKHAARSGDM